MVLNSCILSGSIIAGVFSDISNITFEAGIPQHKAATVVMYSCYAEIVFRPIWSIATRWLQPTTCQVLYCIVCLLSQIVLASANSYEMFVLGLILLGMSMAGYSGLKTVIWIELVTLKVGYHNTCSK